MAITLSYGGLTVALSDRLDWTDEFAWTPVVQAIDYSLTGAMLVQAGTRQAGRPITLEGTQSAAWTTRSTCGVLAAWANLADIELQLVLRGLVWPVRFDAEKKGFEARPMHRLVDGEVHAEQLYLPTLRLLTV